MQDSAKHLEIVNPEETNLVLPPIKNKSPSPMRMERVGGDINLVMKPNFKRNNHFHIRSRSNAVNTALSQHNTSTPLKSRYREEFDNKSNKYNTE